VSQTLARMEERVIRTILGANTTIVTALQLTTESIASVSTVSKKPMTDNVELKTVFKLSKD
jgi:hypothetical protein